MVAAGRCSIGKGWILVGRDSVDRRYLLIWRIARGSELVWLLPLRIHYRSNYLAKTAVTRLRAIPRMILVIDPTFYNL